MHLELDVLPLSILFASLRCWPTKSLTTPTQHTLKKALGSSQSMLVSTALTTGLPAFREIYLRYTELEEDGVRIALTIVDTPGFGDNIDNEFASVLSPAF